MADIPVTALPDGTTIPVFGMGTWHTGESRGVFDAEVATLRRGWTSESR